MADAEREIRIVISGKNLTGPQFEEARRALSGVAAETEKTGGSGKKLKGIWDELGISMRTVTAASLAAGFFSLGREALQLGGRLVELKAATGLSYQELQFLNVAAIQNGTSLDAVAKGVNKLQRSLVEGGDAGAAGAVRKLGLNIESLRKLEPGQFFETIWREISRIEDPARRATIAHELLARNGYELLPLLTSSIEDVKNSTVLMSDRTIENLDRAGDAWDTFKTAGVAAVGELIGKMQSFDGWLELVSAQPFALSMDSNARQVNELTAAIERSNEALHARLSKDSAWANNLNTLVAPSMDRSRELLAQLTDETKGKEEADRRAAQEAERHRKEITELANQLTGRKIQDEVRKLGEAVRFAGGESKISAYEHGKLGEKLLDLWLQGAKLPPQLHEIMVAHAQIGPVVQDTAHAFDFLTNKITLAEFGYNAYLRTLRLPISTTANPFASLNLPTVSMGAPPPGAATQMAQSFAGQFTAQLGPTLLASFQGGGNPLVSVGSMAGQQLGMSFVKNFGTKMTSTFGATFGGVFNALIPGIGALAGPLVGKLVDVFTGGKQANKLRDSLKEKFGDAAGEGLALAVERVASSDAVQKAYDRFLTAGSKKDVEAAFNDLTKAMDEAESVMKKYGLTIEDTLSPQERVARSTRDLTKDLAQLKDLGFSNAQAAKGMAKELNDLFRIALDGGGQLPESMRPYLLELAKGGLLADDLKAKLLGIPVETKAPWKEMQEIAEEFGIDLKDLGPQFQSAKLGETADEFARKFMLLVDNGADVNAVIAGMGTQANDFLKSALRWGIELPPSMRPVLEKLLEAGKLTDDNGEKLESLADVKFGKTLAEQFDPLVNALNNLVDVFTNGLPGAIDRLRSEAGRGIDIPVRVGSNSGQTGSGESMDLDGDGVPNWYDNFPDDPNAYASGGIANGRQVALLAEQGQKEIVGSEAFMTRALTGAIDQIVTARGGANGAMFGGASSSSAQPMTVTVQNVINGHHINDLVISIVNNAAALRRIQIPRDAVTVQVPRG